MMNDFDRNYCRIVPRDFFNEAKLLKCMGMLSISIADCKLPAGISIEMEESGDPFIIGLLSEGSLTISNYRSTVNGYPVIFKTTYNSKSPHPFFCELENCDYQVFDDQGNFDEEFIHMLD